MMFAICFGSTNPGKTICPSDDRLLCLHLDQAAAGDLQTWRSCMLPQSLDGTHTLQVEPQSI